MGIREDRAPDAGHTQVELTDVDPPTGGRCGLVGRRPIREEGRCRIWWRGLAEPYCRDNKIFRLRPGVEPLDIIRDSNSLLLRFRPHSIHSQETRPGRSP